MWGSGDISVYDQVDDPAGAGGACAGAGAFASVQEGVDDGLYQGLLHVFGGGIIKGLGPGGPRQLDGCEIEGGEGDMALIADQFDSVLATVGGEGPGAVAEYARFKGEAGGDGIFGSVEPSLVASVSRCAGDGA